MLASPQASNEALYLASYLFCEELGVTNTRVLSPTLQVRLQPQGKLADIAASDLLLVVGANPVAEQPVASFLIKRAVDRGARLVVVDGADNDLALFAHLSLGMDELDRAVELAARADAPLVLYGAGLTEADGRKLALLKRATFIPLEPGANGRAAVALGLENGFEAAGVEALYVLLGEQAWDGAELAANGAFLVVQASYESSLTERADVVLPAAIWCEASGTLTNLEGQVQQANPAVEPQGQARPDWQILSLLAREMGKAPAASLDELSAKAAETLQLEENRSWLRSKSPPIGWPPAPDATCRCSTWTSASSRCSTRSSSRRVPSPTSSSRRKTGVTVGILTGALANSHNVEVARRMRERCQVLIAVGDCATFGGIVAMRNLVGTEAALRRAYLETESTVEGLIPELARAGPAAGDCNRHRQGGQGGPVHPRLPAERRRAALCAFGAAGRAHAGGAARRILSGTTRGSWQWRKR